MRAVRYTASVVAGAPGFHVGLLHIERFPDRDLFADEAAWKHACELYKTEMRVHLDEAHGVLAASGFDPDRVEEIYIVSCQSPFPDSAATRCSRGRSIAQEILDTMEEGDWGAVVVGRRGISKAEEFLFGSVSNRIIHYAKNCAVWVVA